MRLVMACGIGLVLGSAVAAATPAQDRSGATASPDAIPAAIVVADCAKAMGGEARIRALRTLRVEVVFGDHGDAPIVYEIRRPNQYRIESAGRYVTRFDGRQASQQRLDPSHPSAAPVLMPASVMADVDLEIAWLVPAFFDYPAESLGAADVAGRRCDRLRVTLPFGARVTYAIDAATHLVHVISVDAVLDGKPFHTERQWTDYRDVDGLRYPGAMTYQGRDQRPKAAVIRAVLLNPPLPESRFAVNGEPQGR
jgi:hypothetical protein